VVPEFNRDDEIFFAITKKVNLKVV